MKRTLITLLLFAGFLAGCCKNLNSTTSGETPSPNQRKYELIADIDIFQFKSENLTPAQQAINKALKDIKTNILKDYYNEVEYFFDEDLSEIKNYKSEVSVKSSVIQNNAKIFSCEIETYQYHHGANGCHSNIIGINYLIDGDKIKKLKFADLFESKKDCINFLKRALDELRLKTKYKSIGSEELSGDELNEILNVVQFSIKKDSVKIIFPPYTIACGACGVLSIELTFPKNVKYGTINLETMPDKSPTKL